MSQFSKSLLSCNWQVLGSLTIEVIQYNEQGLECDAKMKLLFFFFFHQQRILLNRDPLQ